MAVTLAQLRTAVRQMADMENSTFVTDAELDDYINRAAGRWHTVLSTRYEDYFLIFLTFTLSTGNTFTLPDDFLKIRGLDYQVDPANGTYRTLRQFNFMRRNALTPDVRRIWGTSTERQYRVMQNAVWIIPETNASGTYRMWYLQRYANMVANTDAIADWQGWHELVIIDAAIKALRKEESETAHLVADREAIEAKIEAAASNRNAGEPETITDVQSPDGWPFHSGGSWGG